MGKELVGVLRGKDNVKYKIYSNGKAYRLEENGAEIECTEFLKKNISSIIDREECDIIENMKNYRRNRMYKISDPPERE